MIVIKKLTKKFGKLYALNNVSAECKAGECVGLIGPNGSGKTTLIKCILGMVVANSGSIYFNDKSITKNWLYRRQIGYMPQIGRYPENMTIAQVFEMMKDIRNVPHKSIDEELMDSFGLKDLMQKRMRTLSGGTTQKVSASLAFLFRPDVLILDEPTAGLDPVASETLKEKIIQERNNGKLILITSHVLSEMDELITEVIYMHEGKPLFHKNLSALKQQTGEEKLSRAIVKIVNTNNL
ncbi:MAG: ABC transporter ATP-binding protein [Ginsengibacter sp.]